MLSHCTILNLDPDYVRTRNFINNTSSFLDHEIGEDLLYTQRKPNWFFVGGTFPFNQIKKAYEVHKLNQLKVLGDYVYLGFDPITLRSIKFINGKSKIISDLLEPYPEAYGTNPIYKAYFSKVERFIVKNSQIVLSVTEEETQNLEKKYGMGNIHTIRNFPDTDVFKSSPGKFENFSIVYFGISCPSRDLHPVEEAIALLQKNYTSIDYHIIGPPELDKKSGINCIYHGWLDDEEAANIIGQCHLGIAPYNQNLHTQLTLQNKSFQYAACDVLPLSTHLKPLNKYQELIKLVEANSSDYWYVELEKLYNSWQKGKLQFKQREILIKNGWTAQDEWKKLKFLLG
ncbi:MAG: hypothetical protein B655_0744 [Methanobacterium sp. Maddingley MBC34]|nr:MAG: hypothetical protein B655_0744 [Methanobacterium sp. Maddingley MBC34]